jgi:glycosyltransferase involved in cell wall biosynthesis
MSVQRVALIFDDRIRPDTTGVYVRRALAELVDVVHFQPDQAEEIPRSGFDLYLSVDDDTEHRLPDALRPRAYWAIDTHRDFPARFQRALACDFVFAAQRDGAERLRAAGVSSASWLPLACDPEIHRRHEVPKQFNVSFVGRTCPGPRDELLNLIRRNFPNHFIGQAYFDEMARVYSASRIVFNRSIKNDVNMRVFEALACGSLLVTNDLTDNGLEELFQDGVHAVMYREPHELVDKIRYYLAHEEEREKIAATGRTEALAKHAYRHRLERMLERVVGATRRPARGATAEPAGEERHAPGHGSVDRADRAASPALVTASGHGRTATLPGLSSIIVPCFNQCDFTRVCIQALLRHTRPTWELILVNNGSSDETGAYLSGVQDAARVPVTIISNATNIGFPRAVNQGLEIARGEYLVLLNNDAVVTDGWLDQLIALTRLEIPTTKGAPEPNAEESLTTSESGTRRNQEELLTTNLTNLTNPEDQERVAELPETAGRSADGEPGRNQSLPATHSPPAATHPIGLVGPMSNYAAPPQLVENVPYRDLDEMHDFASQWRNHHRGQWFTVPKLSGFCVLLKRAVYEAIGGLDERFGLGLFDDDDLALRARHAGFELAVAHDLFVHRFGSRTFAGNGIDAEKLLDENAQKFAAKWGQAAPAGQRVALAPWSPASRGHADRGTVLQTDLPTQAHADPGTVWKTVLPTDPRTRLLSSEPGPRNEDRGTRATISLTVIARDEEKNLPRCLGSVRGLFDEIVVVDTGSTDRTKTIAEEYGARVFDFPWIDDFAAARNAALEHATGDYIFWLDADDVVDPREREKLRALLDGLGAPGQFSDAAYVVRCACDPGEDGSGGNTVVDHVRLFPLRADVRWTYRVHEQILPALRRAGVPVRWTDLTVRHTGYRDTELRARKLDRDTRILLSELNERRDEPFILFNLGAIAIERKDWPGALTYLTRSLRRSAPTDSITRKLYVLIARAHERLGDSAAALRTCADGLALDPENAELWFRKGVVHLQRGEMAQSEASFTRILGLKRPEQFCSEDAGIYGHLTRRNLALLAEARGDRERAARLWREVLAECPTDSQAMSSRERLRTEAHRPGETPA